MRCNVKSLFTKLMVGALLSGCVALPKPFQQEGLRTSEALVSLVDGGAVRLRVEQTLPDRIKEPLESALVEAFALANIPASAQPDFRARLLLTCELLIDRPDVSKPEAVTFNWNLFSADGELAGSFDQFIQGDQTGWLTSDTQLFNIIAGDAVHQLVSYLQQGTVTQNPSINSAIKKYAISPSSWPPKIFLMEIEGAPGDGNIAIQRSLAFILKKEGGLVVKSRKEAQYLVKGFVNVSGPIQGKNDVAITWLVTLEDGKELGKITQHNKVPAGVLDNRWGRLAFAVAKGASAGIKGVVTRYTRHVQNRQTLKFPFREKELGEPES